MMKGTLVIKFCLSWHNFILILFSFFDEPIVNACLTVNSGIFGHLDKSCGFFSIDLL